ncbi:MAG: hypothetical protein Q4F83_11025 [Eubacteriales bacterium]|nr:hypothetical protein [Eubacteriales bacterium]
MDEKAIYQIYVGLMKLHKKYAAWNDKRQCLSVLIAEINQMNVAFNSNFCNAMTDVLRRWGINGFHSLDVNVVAQFYTDLWRFHKKYIDPPRNDAYWRAVTEEVEQLDKKYGLRPLQEYMLAIMDELENGGEVAGDDGKTAENGGEEVGNGEKTGNSGKEAGNKNNDTELRQGDYEQKEQEQSKSE